jgi:death-on-curing protein
MEITLDEAWLKILHLSLVDVYRDTEYPITVGYTEGMISVCVARPHTDIYNLVPFPHLLHKAAVLMESIARFHPFADGNKRVALLATFYFLYWNGYDLEIPIDADQFTIEIAKGNKNLNDILLWLIDHSRRDTLSLLRNLLCQLLTTFGDNHALSRLASFTIPLFVPLYPFMFFREKIQKGRGHKSSEELDKKT